MPTETWYVYYPGHLGLKPVTELSSQRGILWDASVKRVPQPFARSLVADSGFQRALDYDEARVALGVTKKQLAELVKGDFHVEVYKLPREGEEKVPVIVLPAGVSPAALKKRLDKEKSDLDKEKSDG